MAFTSKSCNFAAFMKKLLSRYGNWALSVLVGIGIYLFWRFKYPFALAYQEQSQLFLFDDDYFLERIAEPGGLARYIAEFLVQFYNIASLGALILALLYILVQRLIWHLMEKKAYYALSFVPLVMLWYAMGDECMMLTYVIALIIAMGSILLFKSCDKLNRYVRYTIVFLAIPLLYWLIGPMVLLVAACTLPISMIWALAVMLLSALYLPYPLLSVILGIDYYRSPEVIIPILIAIPVVIALLYWGYRFIKNINTSHVKEVVACMVMAVLAIFIIPINYFAKTYELMEYDYLVRIADWNAIIDKAEKQMPDQPMSVSATNLALAMNNLLGDRIFDFYQRSSEGLLPPFERNYSTIQLTGEIYLRLGLINTAQRFAFEAMEAIPNHNRSGRVLKRLAETNMINGQYKVAEKYLRILEKTIFYRPWAQRMIAMLGDEKAINEHPFYGTLRQFRLQDDFLFRDSELDKICGRLVMHNPDNQVAVQYLLMMPLLDKDIPRFMQYMQFVQNHVNYMPRSCQETIAYAYMQQNRQLPQGFISPLVLQQMDAFGRIYSSGGNNAPGLEQFKNTAWYYLTVGK